MLQVVVPAVDLNLLTIEELRVAVGLEITDDSQDEKLEALGLRVAGMIASSCGVVQAGADQRTLRLEYLTESVRLTTSQSQLFLSRRPIGAVTSVIETGTTLTSDVDFEVDPAGFLTRLSGGDVSVWACGKIVIEYDAGYETVPDDLRSIAQQLAGAYWSDEGTDPMEKSFSIPGVIATERWVDQEADPQMPRDIMNALIAGGYVNRVMVL